MSLFVNKGRYGNRYHKSRILSYADIIINFCNSASVRESMNRIEDNSISKRTYYCYKKKLHDKEIIVYFRNIFIQLIAVHYIICFPLKQNKTDQINHMG